MLLYIIYTCIHECVSATHCLYNYENWHHISELGEEGLITTETGQYLPHHITIK